MLRITVRRLKISMNKMKIPLLQVLEVVGSNYQLLKKVEITLIWMLPGLENLITIS